jgi:hypothetical protein
VVAVAMLAVAAARGSLDPWLAAAAVAGLIACVFHASASKREPQASPLVSREEPARRRPTS